MPRKHRTPASFLNAVKDDAEQQDGDFMSVLTTEERVIDVGQKRELLRQRTEECSDKHRTTGEKTSKD